MGENQKVLFSGIQPTSSGMHIGNYLGAIANWVDLQDRYSSLFCIVDYHATTITYDIPTMRKRVFDLSVELLACGIDPQRCILFVQSDVPQHLELAWIFNTVTPMGDLSRMTQFKEKSKQHNKNINVGLFSYPVLQAADILLYKGEVVPVGEDQVQHIELTREIGRKFNARFGDYFPETKALLNEGARIKGLDGKAKMSKSLDNSIDLRDSADVIWEKLRNAFTDPQRLRRKDPGRPHLCNIFALHGFFSDAATCDQIDSSCRSADIGCFDCKKTLANNMVSRLEPLQQRIVELSADESTVEEILSNGAHRATHIAAQTLAEVRDLLGLRPTPR